MSAAVQPQPAAPSAVAARVVYLIFAAFLGAALMWVFLGRQVMSNRAAERASLEQRAHELAARTLAPGSPLACLDLLVGEKIQAACEKAVFASPATAASATAYVAEELALLWAMSGYVAGGGAGIDDVLLPLRHSLEADRFGFVAHLLAARAGCTAQSCKALALLRDPQRVRANLADGTLDKLLEHYDAVWSAPPPENVVAETTAAMPQPAQQQQAPHRPVNIDFPTAASIPAVSIMNPEPKGPVLPGAAAAAAANPNPSAPGSPKRAHKPPILPPPAATQNTLAGTAGVEPIWPEPVPLPPAQMQAVPQPAAPPPPAAATAPPAAAPQTAAPMQLNPGAPASSASVAPNIPTQ